MIDNTTKNTQPQSIVHVPWAPPLDRIDWFLIGLGTGILSSGVVIALLETLP